MDLTTEKSERRFRRFGILTIASVFFLIFVGGLVRSTGSGMGCPDWPKCFDNWVPPTDVSQLPPDYKERFKVAGHEIAEFDAYKTWTEYINRLIGATTGLFVFFTVFFAIPYLKKDKNVFWLSFLAFILVGVEGWIGAKVVSTNLSQWMITIHMLIALIIVGLLIYTITRSQQFMIEPIKYDASLKPLMLVILLLVTLQTLIGTQVRENIDMLASIMGEQNRAKWVENLGIVYKIHRSFSLVSLIFIFWMMFKLRNSFARTSMVYKSGLAMVILIAVQIFSGKVLEVLDFPRYVQSAHLFIGSLISGILLFITLMIFTKTKITQTT